LMLRLVAKREAELARLAEKRRIAEEQRREEQRQIEEEEEEEAAYQAAQARRMPSGPSTLDILGMALGTINDSLADQNRQVQAEFQQLQRRAANQAQEQQRQRAQQAQQRAAAEASAAADRARQAATDDARRTALAQQATANARDLAARQQIAESRAAEQRQQQRDAATARSYVPRIPQNSTTDYSPTKVASEPPKRSYPPVPEAVSVCVSRGSARFACYGSISAMPSTVGPNAGPGYQTPEQWVAYVGNCDGRGSAIPINDGGVAWTCGYGVSGGLKDVARVTNTQIQGRRTFYCNPSEIYCRRRTPTDER